MFDWLWVVAPAVFIALATALDGRFGAPYFAFSEVVFGYSELVSNYSGPAIRRALVRKASYPIIAGMILSFADRPVSDAIFAGLCGMLLLLWPAVVHGLPTWVASRTQLLFLYGGLVGMAAGASWLGWNIGELFNNREKVVEFLTDQFLSLLLSAILLGFSGLVVDRSSSAIRRKNDESLE